MKYHFKNIGLIRDATIELGDLTILAGPNNTGKTYIAYTLFGFLETCSRYFNAKEVIQNISHALIETGQAQFDMTSFDFDQLFSDMTTQYSSHLHEIFSAREEEFKNAKFSITANDSVSALLAPTFKEKTVTLNSNKVTLSIKCSREKYPIVNFDLTGGGRLNEIPQIFLNHGVADVIASFLFPSPHICVSERLGIPLFYRELDIQKIVLVEHIQKLTDNLNKRDPFIDFFEMLKKMDTRYALPVKDNIDFIRSIPDIIKNDSPPEIAELHEYIVSMTGGIYRHQATEGLTFASKPRSRSKFSLTTNLWSSSIKSLSILFFYLKHVARPGHLLIIDEPEIHLTPQNQIILARMLAACVNKGIKVLITTHSDYLVKEFNNLIMLHNLSEKARDSFMGAKGSPYKPGEALNPNKVKAYLCQKGGVVACRMDQYGMEVSSMDEAINAMNETCQNLSALME